MNYWDDCDRNEENQGQQLAWKKFAWGGLDGCQRFLRFRQDVKYSNCASPQVRMKGTEDPEEEIIRKPPTKGTKPDHRGKTTAEKSLIGASTGGKSIQSEVATTARREASARKSPYIRQQKGHKSISNKCGERMVDGDDEDYSEEEEENDDLENGEAKDRAFDTFE
ncbi:hypothetical protein EAF04_001397 [Stromatinia cepivora]|nr:hypothetical protein EAF04_001397 [Stromatinia cepivora]